MLASLNKACAFPDVFDHFVYSEVEGISPVVS